MGEVRHVLQDYRLNKAAKTKSPSFTRLCEECLGK